MTTKALAVRNEPIFIESKKTPNLINHDSLKIARSQERIKLMELAADVIMNPVFDVLIAFLAIEYMQGHDVFDSNGRKILHVGNGGWVSEATGDAMEVALGAYLLSPAASKMAEQIGPLIKALSPLIATAATA